jgi:hypothetical protein
VSGARLTYAVVTPVRDEEGNLARLAACLEQQTVRPARWVIVDNGSTDGSGALAESLTRRHEWIASSATPGDPRPRRGTPIVRAFHAGLRSIGDEEIVVKLDADLSFEPDYFEELLERFSSDARLGIASGGALERDSHGRWLPRHVTGTSVWGAARAYRRACLDDVLPLEERAGWDGIDELKAQARGWRTATFTDLPFRHHRGEGERDGASWRPWVVRGRTARYMGYRPWYLALRAFHHARREPVALSMLWGFVAATLEGEPVCPDPQVRAYLRSRQSLRSLTRRRREALGISGPGATTANGTGDGSAPGPGESGQRVDVLLVCSGGGHLIQLASLRGAWEGFRTEWVVASPEGSDVTSLLEGERVTRAHAPTSRNVVNLGRNLALAWRVLGRSRPAVVITTGAAIAVPFAWAARARGIRLVYVESLARAERPSLSCRLVAPLADRVYVQWPELASAVRGARYAGTVFSPR